MRVRSTEYKNTKHSSKARRFPQSDSKKFFNKMSEKATSIGVRGEFTAECLSLLGVHNIRIIGCPSFYKYLDGNIPTISQPSVSGGGGTDDFYSRWLLNNQELLSPWNENTTVHGLFRK
mgnify:CR=1 FL=1